MPEIRTPEPLDCTTQADETSEDVLYYIHKGKERKVVVDLQEKKALLHAFHKCPAGGHSGINATVEKLREAFYWDGMKDFVKSYVESCSCQKQKPFKTKEEKLAHISVSEPMEIVGMDIICGLPRTANGNNCLLTVVDHFTKYPDAFPLPSKEAHVVSKALRTFVARYGAPKSLLSDQGREFNNKVNAAFCQAYGIKRILTRPYTPQTNGLCERLNSTLKQRLKNAASTWDENIEETLFSLRCQRHGATKFTPFFLMFGREPRHFAQVPEDTPNLEEEMLENDKQDLCASRQKLRHKIC